MTMSRITLLLLAVAVPALLATDPTNLLDLEVEITLDISSSRVHQGDNVTLLCRVSDMPEEGSVFWLKQVIGQDLTSREIIANDANLNPPYLKFPNYKITKEQSGSTSYYTFYITNVAVQENGEYICSYLQPEDGEYATEILQVYDKVDYIHVYLNDTDNEVATDNSISAIAGDNVYLRLEAGDSVPAANLHIFLGDEEVTEEFSFSHESDIHCDEDVVKDCPVYHTMRSIAESHIISFEPQHRDMGLRVAAVVPGSMFDPFNISIALDIDYEPQIVCEEVYKVRVEADISLSCRVRAYPMTDEFKWFIPSEEDGVIILDPTQKTTYGNYTAQIDEVSFDQLENAVHMTLRIPYVTRDNFMEYTLWASNEVGNVTKVISLEEDTSPIPEDGAPSLSASFLVLACSMLAVFRMMYVN